MRLTKYFLPILKENPKEAEIVSHRLMLRAGMIRQQAAGIYSWLPLGLRVLQKIENIVREEQNRAGAVELLMPTIQPAEIWRESGRYDAYGSEMLRIQDRHEREMLFGPTNEEMITEIFRSAIHSYKDLPLNLYHIQWKFRDELRPRFGIMRGREFLMKDAYSFDVDRKGAEQSYNRMFVAYLRTFDRMGLKAVPMRAETGPIGGDLSHEFVILASTGESQVYCHKDILELPVPDENTNFYSDLSGIVKNWTKYYAATDDMHDKSKFKKIPQKKRVKARGIEVGHIFYFGTKYSKPMGAKVATADGKELPVHMGSYGVGVSRLLGGIIEASHDDNGVIWPQSVAPFDLGLINMRVDDSKCSAACEDLYAKLTNAKCDVLYDDTDNRAGNKFATMDLIGLPWQLIVGPRGLQSGEVELKCRKTGERENLTPEAVLNKLSSIPGVRLELTVNAAKISAKRPKKKRTRKKARVAKQKNFVETRGRKPNPENLQIWTKDALPILKANLKVAPKTIWMTLCEKHGAEWQTSARRRYVERNTKKYRQILISEKKQARRKNR